MKVAATAICHSDIHDLRGDFGGSPPFVGGHETAGYVDEIGANVTYDNMGTLANQKGEEVVQKARVGGFAEYVLVHESQLVKIGDDFPLDLASLLGACAYHDLP